MRGGLRIAQVVHWFLPRHGTGTERHLYGLARELAQRHRLVVFCGEDDPAAPLESEETWDGLTIRRVHTGHQVGEALVRRAAGRFRSPAAEQAFARLLADFQPDLVHVHHLFKLSGELIAMAQRQGIPVVVTLHDYWFICDNAQLLYRRQALCPGPRGGLRCAPCMAVEAGSSPARYLALLGAPLYIYRTRYLRRQLQAADRVIVPSLYVKERLQAAGIPLPSAQVLQHGIPTGWLSGYRRVADRGRLRIGYLGTVAPHKGVEFLLRAFLRLPSGQAELHIHGGGQPGYFDRLRQLAGNAHVFFHGPYEHSALAGLLGSLDLVVVPSLWPENAPATVQEAFLARLPVLAAATGGLPEFVTHEGNGLLFPAGDLAALEAALRRALDEPALLTRLEQGIHPPKTMERYAAEVEAIYEQITACA